MVLEHHPLEPFVELVPKWRFLRSSQTDSVSLRRDPGRALAAPAVRVAGAVTPLETHDAKGTGTRGHEQRRRQDGEAYGGTHIVSKP